MEPLIIKHSGAYKWIRIISSGFIIIVGILDLSLGKSLTQLDWMRSVLFILLGIFVISPLSGYYNTTFRIVEDNLKIKWRWKLREITFPENEIDKITLGDTYIKISRKGKKDFEMLVDYSKKENKTKVYEFLIEYARQKNLPLDIRYKQTS
jgi:hypothetical protein